MAETAQLGEYEHIIIVLVGKSPSEKTAIFDVRAKGHGVFLGTIKWFGRWRQYAFYPRKETIYSADCLVDIAHFIDRAKEKHRG